MSEHGMMPWREQAALAWKFTRWVFWPPDTPLWGHFCFTSSQVACVSGLLLGSAWIVAAGFALVIVTALVLRAREKR